MNLGHPDCPYMLHPVCIVWWKPRYPCISVCAVSWSPHFCSHNLFRMCTCISTWIYANLTVHVWSLPLCIVSWKLVCPYISLCVCPSHPGCGPAPCFECVHASVHEFMSPCLLMCVAFPMHSFMETWVPLFVTVCVSQSPCLCFHTLFRMCTCISTWI